MRIIALLESALGSRVQRLISTLARELKDVIPNLKTGVGVTGRDEDLTLGVLWGYRPDKANDGIILGLVEDQDGQLFLAFPEDVSYELLHALMGKSVDPNDAILRHLKIPDPIPRTYSFFGLYPVEEPDRKLIVRITNALKRVFSSQVAKETAATKRSEKLAQALARAIKGRFLPANEVSALSEVRRLPGYMFTNDYWPDLLEGELSIVRALLPRKRKPIYILVNEDKGYVMFAGEALKRMRKGLESRLRYLVMQGVSEDDPFWKAISYYDDDDFIAIRAGKRITLDAAVELLSKILGGTE